MDSTRSHRASADRLIELLERVKNDCLGSLSGFRVSLPWTVEWDFFEADQRATVTATIQRMIGDTERLRLAVALTEHQLKPLKFDCKKGKSSIKFFFPGPLRLIHGTDCAGNPTLEVRETTSIKTTLDFENAYGEQYTARTAA